MKKISPIGVSIIGPGHIHNNLPNQDSFLIIKKWKYTLLVVSDGMGSKKYADVGSQKACISVFKAINAYVKQKQKVMPISLLFKNIINIWENSLLPYLAKECSATCLFAFITDKKILLARLGDGMICVIGKNSEDDLILTDLKENDFVNSSEALSDTLADREFVYKVLDTERVGSIVITTDGISSDLKEGTHLEFSKNLITELCSLKNCEREQFLKNMLRNWPVQHHTDDKTIALLEI